MILVKKFNDAIMYHTLYNLVKCAQTGFYPMTYGQNSKRQTIIIVYSLLFCNRYFDPDDVLYLSLVVRKPVFCICENKDADE